MSKERDPVNEEGLLDDIFAHRVPTVGELPIYATAGSAGADLKSRISRVLAPGERELVPTGVSVALPKGHVGLVCPKSGLAVREGLTVLNGPGVIDSDYRGEIQVPIINLGQEQVSIIPGQKIAQLVVLGYSRVMFIECETLTETERGTGGFGSTGK